MILVDTSIWIELLAGRVASPGPDGMLLLTTCGPVMQEVFQGLRPGRQAEQFRQNFMALPCLSDPIPRALYVEAADIYREGRRHGLTIRSSLDCLIAAIAIHHKVPVWHRDRDFGSISKFTRLQTVNPLQLSAR